MDNEQLPSMARLLELGFDVKPTDMVMRHHGTETPLHHAFMIGSLTGADPNKPVNLARSPFRMVKRMDLSQFDGLLKEFIGMRRLSFIV